MKADKKFLKIKIYGLVQGVGFRYAVREAAKKSNLTGWVRNEPDGTVYIEAEGDGTDLINFLSWCQHGPIWARVEKADHEFSEQLKNYKEFTIKY